MSTAHSSIKSAKRVMSVYERMNDVIVDKETGVVTHLHIFDKENRNRTFASETVYKGWLS